MIIFLLGFLIGGFLGITFMAILFMGKREDESCHEWYRKTGVARYSP